MTREAVRLWHRALLPDAPTGHERQRLCRKRRQRQALLADVTWGIRDDLALTVGLPLVSSQFVGAGTPPHPTSLDNGNYHTTITDFRIDLRFNAYTRRGLPHRSSHQATGHAAGGLE